ncbi:hypothetical protein PybrP1_003964 [[Pythium] brassicae (nom. inval.)]|nr:hypothetical protein PybrP1_003964 [[Pythium] brassicae (nom. inval.)]
METEELRQTLDELIHDLLALNCVTGPGEDGSAILQSLSLLALRFPPVQTILGRCLSSAHSQSDEAGASSPLRHTHSRRLDSKLSVLATRFLYARETSRNMLELLAALAAGGPHNQQRIVRSITGVVLRRPAQDRAAQAEARTTVFDAGKIKKRKTKKRLLEAELVLYVVTVPDAVKAAFRSWRKRYKQLQNRRLPSGVPPEQGGVPRPCYCDDCLGVAEQFLPTWSLHFQDLNHWTKDADDPHQAGDEGVSCMHRQSASLASDAFAVFLRDFRVLTQELALDDEQQSSRTADVLKKRVCIYYFVQQEPHLMTPGSSPPAFDPLQHASAVEIAPEVAVTIDDARIERTVDSKDEQLRAVLACCRVCDCFDSSRQDEAEVLYLGPQYAVAPNKDALDGSPTHGDADHSTALTERHRQSERLDKRAVRPVPGLSDDLIAALSKLEALVLTATTSPTEASRTAFATKFSESLRRLIKRCNARVTALAICTNSQIATVSDSQRKAGVARCRHCRDLLIQLGKKAKLALGEPLQSKSDTLNTEQLERVAKLVRKTVAQVQAQSLLVQAWEQPDERVTKLRLDCHVWASGFPDPEFYRESDARALANKKLQRELTRQLMQKRRLKS